MSILTTDLEVVETVEATKTYKLSDTEIKGSIDGIEALQQAIYKVLNTEKYEYPIYSFSYGVELDDLIGKDIPYVKVELKRRITECLLQDECITSVDSFSYTVSGDEIICSFNINSIYGNAKITKEVTV
jgi:hypothetical protein